VIKPTPEMEALHQSYMDMVNRLMERIEDLERENIDLRERLGMEPAFDLPPLELIKSLCDFCGKDTGKYANTMTTCDDYVCAECAVEFEAALNTGDTA